MWSFSNFRLERFLLHELPSWEWERLAERVRNESGLQAQLDDLQLENKKILQDYPIASLPILQNALYRAKNDQTFKPHIQASPYALRLILVTWAFCLALSPWISQYSPNAFPLLFETTRTKGARNHLFVFRQTPQGVEALLSGAWARRGDLLQLAYLSADKPYGVIVSLDGRGEVTLHFPNPAGTSTRLMVQKRVPLPCAYELDDAPGYERFFFITAPFEISTAEVIQAAESLARSSTLALSGQLPLNDAYDQYSTLIYKK